METSKVDKTKTNNIDENLKLKVVYGEEEFLIKKFVKNIINCYIEKQYIDFNLKICSFEDFSFDELEIFLTTPALMSFRKIFILKNFNFSKFSAVDIKKLQKLLKTFKAGMLLVVVAFGNSLEIKKTYSFKKLININDSSFLEFSYKTENWLLANFSKLLKKKGFLISKEDLLFLIKLCGRSIERLNLELGKICAFVEEGVISKEDILNLTKPEISNNAFSLTKELLIGNKQKAIEIFNELWNIGVLDIQIFSAITICFLDLYRAKCAVLKGIRYIEIVKFYNYYGKEFRIKNAMLNCKKFSIKRLRGYISLLSRIDLELKTKSCSKNFLIERLLFKI